MKEPLGMLHSVKSAARDRLQVDIFFQEGAKIGVIHLFGCVLQSGKNELPRGLVADTGRR